MEVARVRRTRFAQWIVAAALAVPAAGCFTFQAERLPPRVSEEEWREVLGRLPKGPGGVLLLEDRGSYELRELVTPTVVEAGIFREVREAAESPRSGASGSDWLVQFEGRSWEGDFPPKVVGSAHSFLTLGLLPDILSWEHVEIYRVARAERPEEAVAWIGIPGTRGMVTGLLALLMSALPSWEMRQAGEPPEGPIMARHFALNLAKVLAEDASGRAPETDPEVIRRLATLVGSDSNRIPGRVLDEQVEIRERLQREAGEK